MFGKFFPRSFFSEAQHLGSYKSAILDDELFQKQPERAERQELSFREGLIPSQGR
jgi:hypothetical protein